MTNAIVHYKHCAALTCILAVLWISGCGGSGSSGNPPPPPPPPSGIRISISPQTASTVINQPVTFSATVTGTANTAVTWSVQEATGGSVSNGLYQAPNLNGKYHVIATSAADTTRSVSAEVSVSAPFWFVQAYPQGTAQPISFTPIRGEFGADGKFTTTNILDPISGQQMSMAIKDLSGSPDGKSVVFSIMDTFADSQGVFWVGNIYVAQNDGSGLTNLTNFQTRGPFAWGAQFTPDGKQIIFTRSTWTDPCANDQIWIMNTDGSNSRVLNAGPCGNSSSGFRYPTVSADGTKIAAEYLGYVGPDYFQGIVIMNMDGSNAIQLTGNTKTETCPAGSWFGVGDAHPSFTHDGKTIVFDRVCGSAQGYFSAIYSIDTDGTDLTIVLNDNTPHVMDDDPLIVADKVVIGSNRDMAGTPGFDIYTINPDTSITRLLTNSIYDNFSDDYISWF